MDRKKMTCVVETLNDKAAKTTDANEALKFSQAALNAAHSFEALESALSTGAGQKSAR